jgi:hypothetical protein
MPLQTKITHVPDNSPTVFVESSTCQDSIY